VLIKTIGKRQNSTQCIEYKLNGIVANLVLSAVDNNIVDNNIVVCEQLIQCRAEGGQILIKSGPLFFRNNSLNLSTAPYVLCQHTTLLWPKCGLMTV